MQDSALHTCWYFHVSANAFQKLATDPNIVTLEV